jgi:hypothetical protein
MYEAVLERTWPALFGVPVIAWRLWHDGRDVLAWWAIGLSAVYLYGGALGRYSYGRTIAAIVLLLHLALAHGLAAAESRWLHSG